MDEYLASVSEKALWVLKLVIKFVDNRALIFMLFSIVPTRVLLSGDVTPCV